MLCEAKIIPFPTERNQRPPSSPFKRGESGVLLQLEAARIRKNLKNILFFSENEASSSASQKSKTLGARGKIILRNLENALLKPGSLKALKEELKGNHSGITALKNLVQKAIASGLSMSDRVKRISVVAR